MAGNTACMNRFFRRMRRFGRKRQFPTEPAEIAAKQREVMSADTPPDVTDPRAKSQVHGKVTADKWNQ
jgi:hypothetical protein